MMQVKRVYDPVRSADGARLLVDRLWPRGVRKAEMPLHAWAKELAPSDLLRRRYHAGRLTWAQLQRAYIAELEAAPEAWMPYLHLAHHATLTLLTATRNQEQNHALLLREFLSQKFLHVFGESLNS